MTTLIFPMAGQGARFGCTFKPFLAIDGGTFIEAAFAPFRPYLDRIEKVLFIFLDAQEEAEDVTARLSVMFAGVPHDAVVLPEPTPGPAETLRQALDRADISGPMMVCDCDHALDVGGLFAAARDAVVVCALPTWGLAGEPIESWGVAGIDPAGEVIAIAEKAMPVMGETFRGVIGCYYFADALRVRDILSEGPSVYLSDIVRRHIDGEGRVISVPVDTARFFGDPARLRQATGGAR